PFDTTGSWTTWRTQAVTAVLNAGTNTIRTTSTGSTGGPNLDSLSTNDGTVPTTDWSKALGDSTMARLTPSTVGGWRYPVGPYLWCQYLVFKRTCNQA